MEAIKERESDVRNILVHPIILYWFFTIFIDLFILWYYICLVNFIVVNRVRIIGLHFANRQVSSSYCWCKVVNHWKNVKQFFSQRKFIHNIQEEKKYPKLNCKMQKMLCNSYKIACGRAKSVARLNIFIAKWILNNNLNTGKYLYLLQIVDG